MSTKILASTTLLSLVVFATGCTSNVRPVLYPNAQLKSVGQRAAERDIDDCMQQAEQSGVASGHSGKVAEDTATHATVGAAAGAAVGAVRGNVGRSAAAGAAGAGAASATRGVLKSGEPDAIYKRFVNRCLKERGYEPIGWK